MTGKLFVLSGPSGAGKTTIRHELPKLMPELHFSVSATTRLKRENETHDKDYYFMNNDEFIKTRDEGGFFEWAQVHGNFYGTPIAPILDSLDKGACTMLVIDVQGALQVRKKMPSSVLIFLIPPSILELECRLNNRGTDDKETIKKRLANARIEMLQSISYDYSVINHEIAQATKDVASIIRWVGFRRTHDRQV